MKDRITEIFTGLSKVADKASIVVLQFTIGLPMVVSKDFRSRVLDKILDDARRSGVDETRTPELSVLLRFVSPANKGLLNERITQVLEERRS